MKNFFSKCGASAGFTLVELLVTLAISGVFLSGVYSAFKSQQDSYLAQDQVVEMQQNIRAGIGFMVQELRMAGYDPYKSGMVGIEEINADSVTFTLIADSNELDDDDDDEIDEADESEIIRKITFDFYDAYEDGDNDIGFQVGDSASTKRTIAENIENLEFQYLDEGGNVTDEPDEVKSVQISVLARVGQPDRNYTNAQTYTTASGAVWGPYNDHIRRRFQIVTVHLRNLEI